MNRDGITIVLFLALFFSCTNNVGEANRDTEEIGLIGNVKTVTSKTYRDSTIIEQTKVYLDNEGFIQLTEYYLNDTIAKADSFDRDIDNKIVSKRTDLPNGTSQTQTYIYENDGLKKIIQKLNGVQNTTWEYNNDQDGRKVKETVVINDEVKKVVRYEYVNDSITRSAIYNQEGDKESMIEFNETDTKTETTFQNYFSKDHISTSRIVMTLDSLSNPVEETHFREGKKTDVFTYLYNYDEKMNWTMKFSYSNGELIHYTEREIEYF